MPLQLHDLEGVVFLVSDTGNWDGEIKIDGRVYKLAGEVGTSKNGQTYMQLRAREKSRTEVIAAASPRPSSRARKLNTAAETVKRMHSGKSPW